MLQILVLLNLVWNLQKQKVKWYCKRKPLLHWGKLKIKQTCKNLGTFILLRMACCGGFWAGDQNYGHHMISYYTYQDILAILVHNHMIQKQFSVPTRWYLPVCSLTKANCSSHRKLSRIWCPTQTWILRWQRAKATWTLERLLQAVGSRCELKSWKSWTWVTGILDVYIVIGDIGRSLPHMYMSSGEPWG